ncbi:hypothetical protein BDR06DRAFT_977776 [Suillus hirtellus]|nr:hypothetical protein BDR06DRAFT_977776 [Suillus hirtellus]
MAASPQRLPKVTVCRTVVDVAGRKVVCAQVNASRMTQSPHVIPTKHNMCNVICLGSKKFEDRQANHTRGEVWIGLKCICPQLSTLDLHEPDNKKHHLGMQRHPDGADTHVDQPVNSAQNTNPHPAPLPPMVPNDPFMDTTPDHRHGFRPSALGLYSGEGGGYDFGGLQPQSGSGLNQLRPHQFDQPTSNGYNPVNATPYGDPGSRGHLRNDSSMNHNNFQQQLLTKIQKMNTCLATVESASQIILANQQTANERAGKHENVLKELLTSVDAMMALGASKSTAGKKNISNKHLDLKPIFFELCGIDHKVHGEQTELLAQIPPLENGKAYECLREDPKKTPEMKDDDYKCSVITTMTKSYWQNLSQQISILISAEKVEKLTNKQTNSRCRGRRQTTANHHHGAIPDFEKSYECKGSVALIDTDYGSDYVSYEEAFLWVLDEIHRHCKSSGDNRGVETNAQEGTAGPSSQRRKVTKPKDLHKTTFDAHPSKMSSRLPKSGKSTVLFNTMVNAVWLEGHKEVKVVEGMEWLKDFRKSIREEDLAAEDKKYLDELEEWNTDEEDEGI